MPCFLGPPTPHPVVPEEMEGMGTDTVDISGLCNGLDFSLTAF